MPVSARTLQALMAAGVAGDELVHIVALIDADMTPPKADMAPPKDGAAERRRAYDRARKRNSTGNSTGNSGGNSEEAVCRSTGNSTGNSTGIPPELPPLARVRDNPLEEIPTGLVSRVEEARAREDGPDDWPPGDHPAQLVTEIANPWLDPCKSAGLITTAGRVAAWRRAGASWERDVLPVVRGLCAGQRQPVTTWKYFDAAIARSIGDSRRALAIPEATGPPRMASLTDRIDAENAESRRRAFALLGAKHG